MFDAEYINCVYPVNAFVRFREELTVDREAADLTSDLTTKEDSKLRPDG